MNYDKIDPDLIIEKLENLILKLERLDTQLNTKQEVKMAEENEMDFEFDEEKALKDAFAEARASGKLFNVNSWKMNREKQRAKLNLPTSDPESSEE